MADAGMPNEVEGQVTTTDMVTQTILQIPITDNASNMIRLATIARESSTGDLSRGWAHVALIDKTDGGTPSLVGSLVQLFTLGQLGSATWAVSLTFDAGNAYVQVTGAIGQTINWFSRITEIYVCET